MCLVPDLLPIFILILESAINMPSRLFDLNLLFEPGCSLLLQAS